MSTHLMVGAFTVNRLAITLFLLFVGVQLVGTQLVGQASAAQIDTAALADWEGSFVEDLQGPATSGTLTSDVSPSGGQARAFQDVAGLSAVAVVGATANGQIGNLLFASTTWTETITNTTGAPLEYWAPLSIPEIQLFFSGSGFHGVPFEQRNSSYRISLLVDDLVIFSTSALLRSGTGGHVVDKTGVDLGGVKSPTDLRYTFAPADFDVFLGVVDPNEVISVSLIVESTIDIPGFEIVADASVGDPFGATRVEIGPIATPEPGLSMTVAAGCMSLAGFGRRRTRKGGGTLRSVVVLASVVVLGLGWADRAGATASVARGPVVPGNPTSLDAQGVAVGAIQTVNGPLWLGYGTFHTTNTESYADDQAGLLRGAARFSVTANNIGPQPYSFFTSNVTGSAELVGPPGVPGTWLRPSPSMDA